MRGYLPNGDLEKTQIDVEVRHRIHYCWLFEEFALSIAVFKLFCPYLDPDLQVMMDQVVSDRDLE